MSEFETAEPWYAIPEDPREQPWECEVCTSDEYELVVYATSETDHWDGWSEKVCMDCGARYGRWSHRRLRDGETEPRYGHKRLKTNEDA